MILNLRVYAFLFEAIKASIQRSPWVGGLNERFWELNNSPSTHSVIAQIREARELKTHHMATVARAFLD